MTFKQYLRIGLCALILVGVGVSLYLAINRFNQKAPKAGATSDFSAPCATSDVGTSTLSFLRPGVGTTTLTCPIGSINRLEGNTAIVHLQITATSTAVATPSLVARVEASRTGVDWYSIAIPTNIGGTIATTTPLTTNPYNNLSLNISTSTTPAGDFGGTGTATRIHYTFAIPVPEPFVRVIFTSPTNGGVIGLWAEIYGKLPR